MAAAVELRPQHLKPGEVENLMAFLECLTDSRGARHLSHDIPNRVPSGIPVAD